jgi:cytochrome c551/c552
MGYGIADLSEIDIVGPAVETVATSFKPHETAELQFQWQETSPAEYLAAN